MPDKAHVRWREDGRWVDADTATRPYSPSPAVRAAVTAILDREARRELDEMTGPEPEPTPLDLLHTALAAELGREHPGTRWTFHEPTEPSPEWWALYHSLAPKRP